MEENEDPNIVPGPENLTGGNGGNNTAILAQGGVVNGDNIFLKVSGKAVAFSTSHQISVETNSESRAYKPSGAANASAAALFEEKVIKGLSVSISINALASLNPAEYGYADLLAAQLAGQTVEVQNYVRQADMQASGVTPFMTGNFIIKSLQLNADTKADSTMTIQLENAGAVYVTANAFGVYPYTQTL